MATIRIIPADRSHASVISKLGAETFTEAFEKFNKPEDFKAYITKAFNQQQIEQELEEPNSIYLLAYADNELAGYSRLRESPEVEKIFQSKRTIELQRIYSLQKFIGKGIGKALLNQCLQEAKEKNYDVMWLGVWDQNQHAIEFYTHFGFEPFDSHVFMLGTDAQTDILMKLTIK